MASKHGEVLRLVSPVAICLLITAESTPPGFGLEAHLSQARAQRFPAGPGQTVPAPPAALRPRLARSFSSRRILVFLETFKPVNHSN